MTFLALSITYFSLLVALEDCILFDEFLVLALQGCDDVLGAFEEFVVTLFEFFVLFLEILAVDLQLLLILLFRGRVLGLILDLRLRISGVRFPKKRIIRWELFLWVLRLLLF